MPLPKKILVKDPRLKPWACRPALGKKPTNSINGAPLGRLKAEASCAPWVFVTGATGRLGRLACGAFLKRGWLVRALVRDARNAKKIFGRIAGRGGRIEFFEADFSTASPAALQKACRGIDAVVHAAALVREDAPREEVFRVNVEGTRRLVNAAVDSKVKRFVFISSTNVYGKSKRGAISEGDEVSGSTVYGHSKELAELEVKKSGIEFVILRPCQIYGKLFAGDFERIALALKRGKRFIAAPFGHVHLVHSSDAVRAILLAVEKKEAANNEFTVTSGEKISHKRFAEELAKTIGAKPPIFGIPPALAYSAAFALSKALALIGKKSGFTPENVAEASSKHEFSIEKARKILGWTPAVSLEAGLKEMYS